MLSILHREMRIVSRRRWTFWSRVVTSVLSFICGLFLILVSSFQRGASGSYLFTVLMFVSFWFSLVQGVRRAAASISDEKRDGTLGLLFLTDLRPIDIIGGKLFSVAIPLIQPLLAFLPVLAISVLLGGITGGEIFRAALTLGSVLFYSISAGLFVSSISRKSEETGQSTIFLILAMLALPRLFGWGKFAWLHYFSPWTAYTNIPDPGYRVNGHEFWLALLVTNAFAIALLFGAAWFLQQCWEDQPVIQSKKKFSIQRTRAIGKQKRTALLDRNPGEWLAARYEMGLIGRSLFLLAIASLAMGGAIFSHSSTVGRAVGPDASMVFIGVGVLLILVRLASQASYPLAEARRSGVIEMMVSTPLNPKNLISGQITSLAKQFLPLLGFLLIASIFIVGFQSGVLRIAGFTLMMAVFWGAVALVACTVAAFGMWMGLREKSANTAFFKTLVLTIVLPLMLWCFWFLLPIGYIILLLVSISQLTGRDLQRLIRNEKKLAETTPITPIVAAPPVIKL